MARFKVTRRVRYVLPRRLVRQSLYNPEGEPGFVTAGAFVDPEGHGVADSPEVQRAAKRAASGHLDERARELSEVGANVTRFVELSEAALEHAAKLASVLAQLENAEIAPGVGWASAAERGRVAEVRAVVERMLGLDASAPASPVPVFGRDIPSRYWAVEFLVDQGVSVEDAHAALGLSEGASRKFWCDYTARDDDDTTGQACTYCASEIGACVCTRTAAS